MHDDFFLQNLSSMHKDRVARRKKTCVTLTLTGDYIPQHVV